MAGEQLRSHIVRCAAERPACERLCRGDSFRKSKVSELRMAALRHHHIARLDIAMHHPGVVSGRERRADMQHEPRCFQRLQHTMPLEQPVQRLAIYVLHLDILPAVRFADCVQRHNMGMNECRGQARLGQKRLSSVLVSRNRRRTQHLDRTGAF